MTETGDLLGTLRYMAPETLEGRFDQRSDLFSLGLTLYELLALRPAYGEITRQGNYIGTDAAGERALANRLDGVLIGPGVNNLTVGGIVVGAGNVTIPA